MRRMSIELNLAIGVSLCIQSMLCVPAQCAPNDKPQTAWNASREEILENLLGLVNHRQGKEAIKLIDAQIKKNPSDALNYAMRSRMYSEMDENESAVADADRALSSAPTLCLALTTKSIALLRLDRPKEAIVFSDKAFAIQPKDQRVIDDRIKILFWLGRRKEAIALLEQQTASHPQDGVRRGQLIKMYIMEKAFSKVVEQSTVQLKLHPTAKNNDYFFAVRGDAYVNLGELKKAEQDYLDALKVNPLSLPALRGLIKVYRKTGKVDAVAQYERRLNDLEEDYRPPE